MDGFDFCMWPPCGSLRLGFSQQAALHSESSQWLLTLLYSVLFFMSHTAGKLQKWSFLFVFQDRSSCSPIWTAINYVAKADLEFLFFLLLTSQVLRIQTCSTMPGFQIYANSFFFVCLFWDRAFLYISGYPETCPIEQVSLKLRDAPASTYLH